MPVATGMAACLPVFNMSAEPCTAVTLPMADAKAVPAMATIKTVNRSKAAKAGNLGLPLRPTLVLAEFSLIKSASFIVKWPFPCLRSKVFAKRPLSAGINYYFNKTTKVLTL
jgi:hypothetical protein